VPCTGLGKDNGHGDLLADLETGGMDDLAREIATARSSGYGFAVISWEGMSFMDARAIAKLGKALSTENPWLLIYLREQADIVQTGYLQEIKTDRSTVDIADFRGLICKRSRLRALRYCYSPMRNYARLLRRWMSIIPKGQVIAREYQRELLTGNNVVDDFLTVLDLSPDDEFIRIEINTNISLDVESAIIVNRIDRSNRLDSPRKACIFSLLSIIHSDGFANRYFLSPRRVAYIRWYYRRSNRAIEKVIGSRLPRLFSQVPSCACTYTRESILADVNLREQRLAELQSVPMLFGTQFPHEAPDPKILVSGWQEVQAWGAWSDGNVSEIRFRVPFWMIGHEKAKVNIFIKGRYSGGDTRSLLTVNGIEFGWLDLRRFVRSISLPVSALQPNQAVVIQIRHARGGTPDLDQQTSEMSRATFGIEKFGIQLSNPE